MKMLVQFSLAALLALSFGACDTGSEAASKASAFATRACACESKECVEEILGQTAQWLAAAHKAYTEASGSNREKTIHSLRKIRACAAKFQADTSIVSQVLEPAMKPE